MPEVKSPAPTRRLDPIDVVALVLIAASAALVELATRGGIALWVGVSLVALWIALRLVPSERRW